MNGTVTGDARAYRSAFLDWMACAWAGRDEPAVAATATANGTADRLLTLATAGHVLDFDDTYEKGLAHLSAPVAPAALMLGARAGASIGDVLEAYAAGFEVMAAIAAASHPALYERGWHPTAVTGTVGAATAASRLLQLGAEATAAAQHLAVLGAAGLQAAFGTQGKSLQVGIASAHGARAAALAAQGISPIPRVEEAFALVYGGTWATPAGEPAVVGNWIKAYPCCLQTHSSIEAAAQARARGANPSGSGEVTVHRRSRQAAPLDDAVSGLEAKFSIPYVVAFTLLYGTPAVDDFRQVDERARRVAARVRIREDDRLAESEAVLVWDGVETAVRAARGSPQRPMGSDELAAKVHSLAGDRLDGLLDEPSRPAAEVLAVLEQR